MKAKRICVREDFEQFIMCEQGEFIVAKDAISKIERPSKMNQQEKEKMYDEDFQWYIHNERRKDAIEVVIAALICVALAWIVISGFLSIMNYMKGWAYKFSVNGTIGISKQCDRHSMTCLDGNGFTIKVDKFKEMK